MVSQVRIVCILQIIHGVMLSLMGLLLAAMGPVMFAILRTERNHAPVDPEEEIFMTVMPIVYLVMGLPALIAGVLNIIAGIRALRFRGRTFWMIALIANGAGFTTCYCIPTAAGVMGYGLVVCFDSDVIKAFELGEQGVPAEEIRQRFANYRPGRRIVLEEEEDD